MTTKKYTEKRVVSLFLALAMVMTLVSPLAVAAQETPGTASSVETSLAAGPETELRSAAAPQSAAAPLAAAPEGAFSEIYIDVETASGPKRGE